MAGTLDGKVAVITGSGRGIGRGIALALAGEGARIVVCGRTLEPLDDVVTTIIERGGHAVSIRIDVTDTAARQALIDFAVTTFGTIDILVNNAQSDHGSGVRLLDVSDETFMAGFQSGPAATLRLMKLAYPYLTGDGVIINLASSAGLKTDNAGLGAYGALKEAIRTLTRAAAVEWGAENIRTHVICPLANLDQWEADFPERASAYRASVPLGRFGEAERDIGRAVVFLCGPDSAYMTGDTIMLDGGRERLR